MRDAGVGIEVVQTTLPHQGIAIARAAVRDGRRRLLVAGGDGSAHDVVNGIMDAGLDHARETTLALAPLGTGNDWARTLGIDRDPAAIVDALTRGRTVPHDVGVLEFPGRSQLRRWFVNVAGAGYDAFVLSRLPAHVSSTLAYLRGAVSGLLRYRSPRFRVSSETRSFDERLLLVFAANGRYCGNAMHVAPAAQTDDGRLDVVAIEELGVLELLAKLPSLYNGRLHDDPVVRHFTAERLWIQAMPAAAVEADGQIVGETPVEISIVPRALSVVVPR